MTAMVSKPQLETEAEFQQVCACIARAGQATTASHNQVVLAAGSLGVSALVCLLNNGDHGQTETTANLLGPFWREGSPRMESGSSLVRSATAGTPIFVDVWIRNRQGPPVEGADVDVWHSSSEGFYENQDPEQADMNLRGTFTTDAQGHVAFCSIKPPVNPARISPNGRSLARGR